MSNIKSESTPELELEPQSNIVISVVVVLVIIYGAIMVTANANPGWFDNQLIASIVRAPILKVISGKLSFSIQGDVKKLSFHFDRPIIEASKIFFINQTKGIKSNYKLENSEDNHWLYFQGANEGTGALAHISIEVSSDVINNRQPVFIDRISLDGRVISATELFQKYIKVDKSNKNIVLYYPMALANISNTLANTVGGALVYIILVLLLLMMVVQLVMFVLGYFICKIRKPLETDPLHMIDHLTETYAIPLGLLGTIISVWYSLEVTNQSISNYGQLVEIIKIAIFTSVLGVSSTLLYEVRRRIYAKYMN